ncbi:CRISPR-associated helicase Cas3' [Salinivibrio costicola]|uniref:CRISPR-associated helicase Cas3 n=1 Tax=Salinivibrio costicola TaxID=51367 RepID=A0ABX6K8D7_SALCS|nr:CRISPR-associated helicase Cas3' [Salinivibrio costicola]QIR07714.1 CRISPR-associated helicase Cas3' [Salinivibrio costicola]
MDNEKPYFSYWGKASADIGSGDSYHQLAYHCLDVAAVSYHLLHKERPLTKAIAEFLELSPEQLRTLWCFMISLHDLGKYASAFQELNLSVSADLLKPRSKKEYDGREYRHDRLGYYFWQQNKTEIAQAICGQSVTSMDGEIAIYETVDVLAQCVLGHHGQPVNRQMPRRMRSFTEARNHDAVTAFIADISELFQPQINMEILSSSDWRARLEQVSWQLAGLAVLADWIGSDTHFFPYVSQPQPLEQYWHYALACAEQALDYTDLSRTPTVIPFSAFSDIFPFSPTPLQVWAASVEINDQPQLFILEDMTGAGKTEAALTLTHRLMAAGAADGFYFGLPTMATSNAMFDRIANHYTQMVKLGEGEQVSITLAHGARDMNDRFREMVHTTGTVDSNYHQRDATVTAQCNAWLADSRKKALLAPVGVGTIDQALLAVLPRRHQSLRLLGLNRKVLIFDEIHAADEYMLALLESLLSLHLHQGGSVILLTATLSQQQRQRLCQVWQQAAGLPPVIPSQDHFPLATHVATDKTPALKETAIPRQAKQKRAIAVDMLTQFDDCLATALTAVSKGQCVVWIRNTVDDAREAYETLLSRLDHPERCHLFHSRFILADRKNIEKTVLDNFGKSSSQSERQGRVLVATQVFQESLDADADVMISDICPIDDLIQRAGRLHRHKRNKQGAYIAQGDDERDPPVLYIHAPSWEDKPKADWLSRHFQPTQFVYRSPGRLWLGLRKLRQLGEICMPMHARELIEAVYSDEALAQIPTALQPMEDEYLGKTYSIGAKAQSQCIDWQYGYCDRSADYWFDDETDISTRYNDIETVDVLLVNEKAGELVPIAKDNRFAVALSTVKLSKGKYAEQLAPLPERLEPALTKLIEQHPHVKYMKIWLPENDSRFAYSGEKGFYERPQEAT